MSFILGPTMQYRFLHCLLYQRTFTESSKAENALSNTGFLSRIILVLAIGIGSALCDARTEPNPPDPQTRLTRENRPSRKWGSEQGKQKKGRGIGAGAGTVQVRMCLHCSLNWVFFCYETTRQRTRGPPNRRSNTESDERLFKKASAKRRPAPSRQMDYPQDPSRP